MCTRGLSRAHSLRLTSLARGGAGTASPGPATWCQAHHMVPAPPQPSLPPPPPLTLTLLWNVCSRVCTLTKEEAVNAAGAWPLSAEGADPSPARAEQYVRRCRWHTGRPPATPPQPSGSGETSSRRGLLRGELLKGSQDPGSAHVRGSADGEVTGP